MLIKDYDDVLNELDEIVKKDSNFKKVPSTFTSVQKLEIPSYTYGNGDNHIILVAGTHGSEIISVNFMLEFMKRLKDLDTKDYTFHIIPVHNPEGYIISTFAIKTVINKDMSDDEVEKISKDYFLRYRQDDINYKNNPLDRSLKKHQEMFINADYKCIPDKYGKIKKRIKEIYEKNNLPKGSMVVWRGNANGVETNRDNPLNTSIVDIINGNIDVNNSYANLRYNNIPAFKRGPIGIISDNFNTNTYLPENEYLYNLIDALYKKGEYCGLYTFHSTGGMIYSKLSYGADLSVIDDYDRYEFSLINDILAKNYISNTKYKTLNGDIKPGYKIVSDPDINGFDEFLRVQYPAVLLIELSYMGGNPIGPFGDLDNNYYPTIENNIKALIDNIKLNKKLKPFINRKYDIVDKGFSI